MRGMFLRMVLWFWASLVIVAVALHAAVIATSTPTEVRVQRFSDTALTGYGRQAAAILEHDGTTALAAYLERLERETRIHAVMIDDNGRDATGRAVTTGVVAAARRADELGHAEMQVDGGLALKAHRLAVAARSSLMPAWNTNRVSIRSSWLWARWGLGRRRPYRWC